MLQMQESKISFSELMKMFRKNFETMVKDEEYLYIVDLDKDQLWNLYLDSFPAGTNEIFRTRRFFDCSCCRHFIKSFGNVVTIKDNKVKSIWDFGVNDPVYTPVFKALTEFVESKQISDVFVTKEKSFGTEKNFEQTGDNTPIRWDHFYIELPEKFINSSFKTIDTVRGNYRAVKNVFERSLTEISEDAVLTVLELINQKSLYKGEEWERNLRQFLAYKREFIRVDATEKDNYLWIKSLEAGAIIGKIRNHSIGVLLTDISNGMDLDEAVRRYEKIVAPTNYKRPKAIFTQKMLEDAKAKLEELGLLDSLGRRFATLDDITVNNTLYSNRDAVKRMEGLDVFEELSNEIVVNPKNFSKVEEISIEDFIKNVLPTSEKVEVLLENHLMNNMVSLIAPENLESKHMFKWNNNFSWAYTGNITDSNIRENVKNAGGKVDGVLRFSIQWNDEDYNPNDFDAHCKEPNRNHIFFAKKRNIDTSGMLDVDIIWPKKDVPAVENITWTDINKMERGTYKFFVHCYHNSGGISGFKAEIEFNGQIYRFDYNKPLRQNENVHVAEVTFDGRNFTIKEMLPSTTSSREVWNLKTNQFHPVSIMMYSPNFWDYQEGKGHRHYFFMLKNCVNDETPNGFFNEYLKEDLLEQKRVFEALGSKMRVKDVNDQLSGIGFSSTKRNEVLVRVEGQTKRVLKVKI